ncbi:hypothetical protein EXN66_Car001774 [Channa argus]|uniref:Uncharacterized protein n=1 Tax=Channa argus TaxID=215402 RepID=A0A6G1R0X2_CHAAH|nr:hypothetical protein EXN66_Car001774 [Channa argus]
MSDVKVSLNDQDNVCPNDADVAAAACCVQRGSDWTMLLGGRVERRELHPAVTDRGIRRSGDDSQCCSLNCSENSSTVRHNVKSTIIPVCSSGSDRGSAVDLLCCCSVLLHSFCRHTETPPLLLLHNQPPPPPPPGFDFVLFDSFRS